MSGEQVEKLKRQIDSLARRLAGRFEETEKLRAELAQAHQRIADLTRERDEARFQRDQERHGRRINEASLLGQLNAMRPAVNALRDLITLKDGPRDAIYEARKPAVWAAARAAVDLYREGRDEPA